MKNFLIITIVSVVLVATLIHEHYQKQIFRDGDIQDMVNVGSLAFGELNYSSLIDLFGL